MNNILIVTGGTVEKEFLKQILVTEEITYIIGVDRGLEVLEELSIKPDFAVGDFDSAGEIIREKYAGKDKTLILNPKKDYTDTHVALFEALGMSVVEGEQSTKPASFEEPDKIVILGATGSRMDHTLGNINLLLHCVRRKIKAFLLDQNNKIQLIDRELRIKKTEQYGRYVSCIPFSDVVEGITLKGFLYNMQNGCMKKEETIGLSNEIREEEGHITVEKGYLFVMETKD